MLCTLSKFFTTHAENWFPHTLCGTDWLKISTQRFISPLCMRRGVTVVAEMPTSENKNQ